MFCHRHLTVSVMSGVAFRLGNNINAALRKIFRVFHHKITLIIFSKKRLNTFWKCSLTYEKFLRNAG